MKTFDNTGMKLMIILTHRGDEEEAQKRIAALSSKVRRQCCPQLLFYMIIFVTPGHFCHTVIMVLNVLLSKEIFTCIGFQNICYVSGKKADSSHYHNVTTGFFQAGILFST